MINFKFLSSRKVWFLRQASHWNIFQREKIVYNVFAAAMSQAVKEL